MTTIQKVNTDPLTKSEAADVLTTLGDAFDDRHADIQLMQSMMTHQSRMVEKRTLRV